MFIIMQLKHKKTRKRVNILCVHLKAFEEFSALRAEQTEFILNILKETIVDKDDVETELAKQPIIICGDFNGDTNEPFYQLLVNSVSQTGSFYMHSTATSAATTTSFDKIKLTDAYYSYRNFYKRKAKNIFNVSKNVDYIFFTHSTLRLLNYLNLESDKQKMMCLPNLSYPSDHMSLVCDFQFA